MIKKSCDSVKTRCVIRHHLACKLRLLCCRTFLTYILSSSLIGVLAAVVSRFARLPHVQYVIWICKSEWKRASSAVTLINAPQKTNLDKSAGERSLTPVSQSLGMRGKRTWLWKKTIRDQNQKCIAHFRQKKHAFENNYEKNVEIDKLSHLRQTYYDTKSRNCELLWTTWPKAQKYS